MKWCSVLTIIIRFREECRAAGKSVLTWTVNEPEHMMEVGLTAPSSSAYGTSI